jgi:hypothetical protein
MRARDGHTMLTTTPGRLTGPRRSYAGLLLGHSKWKISSSLRISAAQNSAKRLQFATHFSHADSCGCFKFKFVVFSCPKQRSKTAIAHPFTSRCRRGRLRRGRPPHRRGWAGRSAPSRPRPACHTGMLLTVRPCKPLKVMYVRGGQTCFGGFWGKTSYRDMR